MTEQKLVELIQRALNDEAVLHRAHGAVDFPIGLYQMSPGQLPDHVHHRIAKIAARAVMPEVATLNILVDLWRQATKEANDV